MAKYKYVFEHNGKCEGCPMKATHIEEEYDDPGCDCCEPTNWTTETEICSLLGRETDPYTYDNDIMKEIDCDPECPLQKEVDIKDILDSFDWREFNTVINGHAVNDTDLRHKYYELNNKIENSKKGDSNE